MELKRQVERQNEQIDRYGAEISKANEIIRKLQDEILSLKSKLKTTTSISGQQEKLSADLQATIDRQRQELEESRSEARNNNIIRARLENENAVLKDQLERVRRAGESKEQIIEFLQRSVNAADLDRVIRKGSMGPFGEEPSFSFNNNNRSMASEYSFLQRPIGSETSFNDEEASFLKEL